MKEVEIAIQPIERMQEEISALRRLLWLLHGCPIATLYGDDGEMQCNNIVVHKLIDFVRDTSSEIEDKLMLDEATVRNNIMKKL